MADLTRFVDAQRGVYEQALAELRAGRKRSHWMWFIFPQIAGLGRSETARTYAIADRAEATAYLAHPLLGPRLVSCANALLEHADRPAAEILGAIDAVKLRSSATLFDAVGNDPLFGRLLDAYFGGAADPETLRLLG